MCMVKLKMILDVLFKLRSNAENNCHTYKRELVISKILTKNFFIFFLKIKTNKIFEENENKYFPLIDKIRLKEESRISFIKYHFEKFAKILEDYNETCKNLLTRLNNALIDIDPDIDMLMFDEKFKFIYNDKQRIPREEFVNYELYRRSYENLLVKNEEYKYLII